MTGERVSLRTSTPSGRLRLALSCTAAVAVVVPLTGAEGAGKASRPTLQTPQAYSQRYDEPVAPGVQLQGYFSPASGATVASDVLSVDLSHPGVTTSVLVGRGVTDAKPVGVTATATGAVAAVNGDYFAIGGSQAPVGPVLRDGRVLKATGTPTQAVGVGTDGVARTAAVSVAGAVGWAKSGLGPLASYNADVVGSPRTGLLAVFDHTWGSRPVSAVGLGRLATALVVDSHRRLIKRTKGVPAGLRVPGGGAVVVATGPYAALRNLKLGTQVRYRVAPQVSAPAPFRWAMGYGLTLVSGGRVFHHAPSDDSDPHAARTALGWKDAGRTLLLVTAERGTGSVGQGANEIADELAAMGATDAVLLDGGGSTTLVARNRGAAQATGVGALQDGYQRPVPVAIAVFVPKGDGVAAGLDVHVDSSRVFAGLSRRVTVRGYDNWWGPAAVDTSAAAYSSDPAGALTQVGPNLVRASSGASGATQVLASAGGISGSTPVHVMGPVSALSIAGTVRLPPGGPPASLPVTGYDDSGNEAAVDASDVVASATYDPALVALTAADDGNLLVQALPGTNGQKSNVVLHIGDATASLLVRNGYLDTPVNPALGDYQQWSATGGTTTVVPTPGRGSGTGLRVDVASNSAATVTPATVAELPKGTAHLALTAFGDGRAHTVRAVIAEADGQRRTVTLGVLRDRGWATFDVAVPTLSAPGTMVGLVASGAPGKVPGYVILTGLLARI